MYFAPPAEPRPQSGTVGLPAERRQILQLSEEADVQQVVPEPGQPVAVQQLGQQRADAGVQRAVPVVRRRRRRRDGRPAPEPAATARPAAADDQFRLAARVRVARFYARLPAGHPHRAAAAGAAADDDHAREKQKQILPNSVIIIVNGYCCIGFFFLLPHIIIVHFTRYSRPSAVRQYCIGVLFFFSLANRPSTRI